MTHKDIGEALELYNAGISLLEIAVFYNVDAIDLNNVFKGITTFKNPNDRLNNTVRVEQSKINTDNDDNTIYQ